MIIITLLQFSLIPLAAQNTRYVVVSGARQKDEDWDPEENGGYAVHGKVTETYCTEVLSNLAFRYGKRRFWSL